MTETLAKWFDQFWSSPLPGVVAIVFILVLVYFAYVKKQGAAKAVIEAVVREYLNIANEKGVTVEIFVDNLIARAIAKVKETPDKTDRLVLMFLESSFTRTKLIEMIKSAVAEIAGEDAIIESGSRPSKVEEPEKSKDEK